MRYIYLMFIQIVVGYCLHYIHCMHLEKRRYVREERKLCNVEPGTETLPNTHKHESTFTAFDTIYV